MHLCTIAIVTVHIMHNCYSNRAYMHGYCNTCINILVIFSLSLYLCCSHLTLPLALLSVINITPLPHEELAWSTHHYHRSTSHTSHHCRRSASNHTPPNQIAADHSPLNLRFSHLIKIKPLPPMNSLIKIKPLSSINIKPLPHKAWSNRRRSTHWFLVVWSIGFRVGWVMIWLLDWVGFGLNGFLILGWSWMVF